MFEPTTFPNATSLCPRRAAMTDVTNSGMDVPTATMVSPITASESPTAWANATAPVTRNRAERMVSTSPPSSQSSASPMRTGSGALSATSFAARRSVRKVKIKYPTSPAIQTAPARRSTLPQSTTPRQSSVAISMTDPSRAKLRRSIARGAISAATPRISRMLAMLEPTMLPSAMSGAPSIAA